MVRNPDVITELDPGELSSFNFQQIDRTKDKLVNINKVTIKTAGE
jgi:hypothetical protein